LSALLLFLLKKGSRNALNNERENPRFVKNIQKIFGFRLVHMDTAEDILRLLEEDWLETLHWKLIHLLLEKKIFHGERLSGKYFLVAVDGTHVMTVTEGHCKHCLFKEFKSGEKVYFHNVLEAKLVTKNGFSISLASEWIENEGEGFDKQDCEQKAFKRLAQKLKKEFSQLKICILADGLYSNSSFFDLCDSNQWQWIVTLKDGNLKTLWQELIGMETLGEIEERKEIIADKNVERNYRWYNGFIYHGMPLYWFECLEHKNQGSKKFAYVSSIKTDYHSILETTEAGRLRWRIENQGFLNQKQRDYALGHQYSRVSMKAMKNYYKLMQIAHLINQLFERQQRVQEQVNTKMTLKHLWIELLTRIRTQKIKKKKRRRFLNQKIQIRFA